MSKRGTGVTIIGLAQFKNRIEKISVGLVHNDDTYNELGSMIVEQIKGRIRDRKGDYKQKPLSDITVETRKLLAKANSTSPFYKPNKSNLTFTGQLLNSIKSSISVSSRTLKIFMDDFRSRTIAYKDLSKFKKGTSQAAKTARTIAGKAQPLKTNNDIRKELEAEGRIFFVLNKDLLKRVERDISKWIYSRKAEIIKKYIK